MDDTEGIPIGPLYPEISDELESMVKADQDMREKNLRDSEYWDDELDKKNTDRMKEIITQIGWPTVSKMGEATAHNAWLLVQHADHDVDFQEKCLELMKKEAEEEIEVTDIAYLEDRVLVNRGQLQIYGTQFTEIDGERVPKPIENEAEVNRRRQEVGLGTIEEYTAHMKEKYGNPNEQG